MIRIYTPTEIHAIFEAEGYDYADVLDAMDTVQPTAETRDDNLYDSVAVDEIRLALTRETAQ